MTDSRLSQLKKWSDPKSYPHFEMVIYKCGVGYDECKQLVEIVDTERRVHIEEGCRRYFGEAWK
jgi:hypothetical protein